MELPNPELVFALDSTPYLKGILRIEMGCGSEATKSRRVNWGCAGWRRGSYLSGSARSAFVPLLHLSLLSLLLRVQRSKILNAYLIFSLTILTILSPTITAIFSINSAGEVNPTHEQLISPSTYLSLPSESVSRIKSAVQMSGKS